MSNAANAANVSKRMTLATLIFIVPLVLFVLLMCVMTCVILFQLTSVEYALIIGRHVNSIVDTWYVGQVRERNE